MRGPQHEFCAKMKFPAQKNKNSSVNGTTSLAVIVGPKCLIAHLLAPHDRGFSPLSTSSACVRIANEYHDRDLVRHSVSITASWQT